MISGADSLTVTTSNNLTGSASAQTLSNALAAAGSLSFAVGGLGADLLDPDDRHLHGQLHRLGGLQLRLVRKRKTTFG